MTSYGEIVQKSFPPVPPSPCPPLPVRALLIITRLPIGGAPRSVLATAEGLRAKGYEVCVVSGPPSGEEGSLVEEARNRGIEPRLLPALKREVAPVDDLLALFQLYCMICKGRYRIVHTHLSKAGILGRLAARWAGVPVVVHTYHGDVLQGYFGQLMSGVFLAWERLIARYTDRLIAVSHEGLRRYVGYRVAPADKFVPVHNGIAVEQFRYAEESQAPSAPDEIVGAVSVLIPVKGLECFLEAAGLLVRTRPHVKFVVVGGGRMMPELVDRASSLGLSDRVTFTGLRSDVGQVVRTFDVFVLSSLSEGTPLALMEAMACGVPAVATRVGGIPEIVVDGETGILVPRANPRALAEAVAALLDDPARARGMGRAARRRVVRDFAVEGMVERIDAVYRELLERKAVRA